jgi:hypothetical protein
MRDCMNRRYESGQMKSLLLFRHQPASSGTRMRFGIRQSMPSSNIDSCAGVNDTRPVSVTGQTK